jgi:hypothetical protein
MALAFTKTFSNATTLQFTVTSAGAESGDLLIAAFNAAASRGPLKDWFAQAATSQAAARALLIETPVISIELEGRLTTAIWCFDANTDGANAKLTLTASAVDATGAYLTIKFNHSIIQ